MKMKLIFLGLGTSLMFFAGCETVPPGREAGPHGTIAYNVPVESSEPGVRIEVNNEFVGTTPLTLKIFGDKDGTFHDFGSYEYVVQAFPLRTNQFVQTRIFHTGKMFSPEDYIPRQIYFDMNQTPVAYAPPAYPPPAYYYPPPSYYYGPPVFYGPRVFIGPRFPRHHR